MHLFSGSSRLLFTVFPGESSPSVDTGGRSGMSDIRLEELNGQRGFVIAPFRE